MAHDRMPRPVASSTASEKSRTASGGSEVPKNRMTEKITVSEAISMSFLRGMICSRRLGIGRWSGRRSEGEEG